MRKISLNEKNINEVLQAAVKVLKDGGIVVAPSDTVYGLLVDATCQKAVEKLRQFKNRPPGKPISVFLKNLKALDSYTYINSKQRHMLDSLLPGPFTVVLNSKHKVFKLLESEKGTLGIRIPDYDFINRLTTCVNFPITATSANLNNNPACHSIESLLKTLSAKKVELIELVIDFGKLPRNKPSTIIDLTQPNVKVLRHGDIVVGKQQQFLSKSTAQTLKVGEYIINKYLNSNKNKPLVFIVEGNLGVGKTVLVKGMANKLGIKNIISPTYVIYYEYKISNWDWQHFYHFDLYQIEDQEEFNYLGIESYLQSKNILCFEWGEKTGDIIDMLKSKGEVVYISMKYCGEKEREIRIIK